MALFKNYPIISYDNRGMRNLSLRVAFRDRIKQNRDLWFRYEIQDHETPEDIAYNQYGDSNEHWIILFLNDIIDPFHDWVLSRQELITLAENKHGVPTITMGEYQADGYNRVHHWEYNGVYYYEAPDSGSSRAAPEEAVPYTLLEWEESLNDAKREIKVLYPEFLDRAKKELRYLIDNGY